MSRKKSIVKAESGLYNIKRLAKKIESSSSFVKDLDNNEKKRYLSILEGLQSDTANELTDTEYESISKMVFFCDEFERVFKAQGVENADTDLLETYRKMKTQITIFMKDYREGKKVTPPSINIIKNFLVKVDKTIDEIDEIKFDSNEPEVIDIDIKDAEVKNGDVVRPEENKEDKEND